MNTWKTNGDTLALSLGEYNINYDSFYVRLEIPSGIYRVAREINTASMGLYSVTNATDTQKIYYKDIYNEPNSTNDDALKVIWFPYNGCFNYLDTINIKYAPLHYYRMPLFSISNVGQASNHLINGVEIIGTGPTTPVFKYADNLHIGWTDTLGNYIAPYYTSGGSTCAEYWNFFHQSNTLFSFSNCKNIKISNIEIDGNTPHAMYMASGFEGYQGGAHGILFNSKQITLQNVYIHHMQMDGIYLSDKANNSPTHFVADSLVSEYNRRQAFTWSVGDSVVLKNSQFNYSGAAESVTQPGFHIASAPAAGIDFEYGYLEADDISQKYMI